MIYFNYMGFCSLMITVMTNNQKLNVKNYSEIHIRTGIRKNAAPKHHCAESASAETSLRRIIPAPNRPAPKQPSAEWCQRRNGSAEQSQRQNGHAESLAPNRPRRIVPSPGEKARNFCDNNSWGSYS